MKETKYTKEDWINGKCALEWENDKAKEINKFFKECNKLNNKAVGAAKYYYCTEKYQKGCYACAYTTNLPIVKIDDIVMEEIYSIEDLKSRKDGKCWVVQIENREQYNFLLNYFPNMMSYDLIYDGYLVDKTNTGKSHFSSYWREDYNKITITQIKEYVVKEIEQLGSNNMETKKIIGYLVKKEYAVHAKTLIEKVKGLIFDTMQNGVGASCNFTLNSSQYSFFKEAGVLDIWFTPVFEPEKPKEKVITLSNNKSVKIKKEGLYTEGRLILIKYIEDLFNVDQGFGGTNWKVQYNNFDIGCYKNLNRKDLENILEAYKSLN